MYDLILKNISRFITLTPDEEKYFTSLLKVKKLKKKQYLLQEGDVARYDYFVNKGCLRTYSIDDKGQEHVVQFSIEDWWTGDMYSFPVLNRNLRVFAYAPIFMSVIIIIILVSLKHNDDIFLVGGQKNLVFYRNKPSEDKVVEFIEAIKDARKDYFKKSFSSFDKTTTEEEYYGRLQWLKRQEMITADEYDELKHIFDIQKLF